MRNKDFLIVEKFVSLTQEKVANVRKYTKAVVIPNIAQVSLTTMNQLFQIRNPGKLQVFHVREVDFHYMVTFITSIIAMIRARIRHDDL